MHEGALIGGVLARLLRVPLVFDFQGSMTAEMTDHNFLDANGRLYPWVVRLEKLINRLPHAILTSSIKASSLLQDRFQVPAARLHPLPDCANVVRFDPEKFSPEAKRALRQQLGIPDGRPIIAYLGLLTDYQGIPHLIEAAVRMKQTGENAHFLIMGYPNVGRYQAMANQAGVADIVTFTGKVQYQHAPAYLSLGDIGVAPKMSSSEGSGKLLNYMALGQPVVAYDSAVHREYLGEWGVYAPSGDVVAFAEVLCDLLHDPERRRELGHKLRQRALDVYSWREAGEKIISVYTNLTK